MKIIKSLNVEECPNLAEAVNVYNTIRSDYLENGYTECINFEDSYSSNMSAIIMAVPILIVFTLIAYLTVGIFNFSTPIFLVNIFLIFITTPIHELIHGLGWAISPKSGFSHIYLYIPITKTDAFCHTSAPLTLRHYALGTLMPLIILSIIPLIVALVVQSGVLFYFALFSAVSCGSDIKNTLDAFKHKGDIFLDYPTDCGFTCYHKNYEP